MQPELVSQNGSTVELQFLWVELTNQCNLQCSHCYAESGPNASVRNALSSAQYRQLIFDAYENGCRQIQFYRWRTSTRKSRSACADSDVFRIGLLVYRGV